MKKLMRWRYYCEHCKKSGCSGFHIKLHEKSCTMNPDRACRMCELLGEAQTTMADLLSKIPSELLTGGGDKQNINVPKGLSDAANDCPACILAALRQSGALEFNFFNFDFKAECKSIFDQMDEDRKGCYDQ